MKILVTAELREAIHESGSAKLLRALGCSVTNCILCLCESYADAVPCDHKVYTASRHMRKKKVPFTRYELDVVDDAKSMRKATGEVWCTCRKRRKRK